MLIPKVDAMMIQEGETAVSFLSAWSIPICFMDDSATYVIT
jgi:hypothetical protein